jgi:outer membrane protein TolC
MLKITSLLAFALYTTAPVTGQNAAGSTPLLALTLKQAIEIGLSSDRSDRIRLVDEDVRLSRIRYREARANLLPDLSITTAEQNQTRNLNAEGFRFATGAAFTIPPTVGPYNTFDARIFLNQPIFNLAALVRSRAARASIQEAQANAGQERDQVAARIARAYMRSLHAKAVVEALRIRIRLAQDRVDYANDRHVSGEGDAVGVVQERISLMKAQESLLDAEQDQTHARRELLDAMSLALDAPIELTDELTIAPVDSDMATKGMEIARQSRLDLKAQRDREEREKMIAEAARLEHLPTVQAYADAGDLSGYETHTLGISVSVPVFDSGRIELRRAEAMGLVRQEELRDRQMQKQVALDIRNALDSLDTARRMASLADQESAAAQEELERAQRRADAGATSKLEIIDAQLDALHARQLHDGALLDYNLARVALAEATGKVRALAN